MTVQQPIEMVRGTTKVITVTVRNEDGGLYALPSGAKLILGVKYNSINSDCCIKKVLTEGAGVYRFKFVPEDTENLECGRLCYDVGLQIGADYFPVIPCSPFVLTHNVTRRET